MSSQLTINRFDFESKLQLLLYCTERCKLLFIFLIAVAGSYASTVQADMLEYSSGHADIRMRVSAPGAFELFWNIDQDAVVGGRPLNSQEQFSPNEVFARASDDAIFKLSEDVPFLGAAAGKNIWILPQSNDFDLPFLGFSTASLPTGTPSFSNLSLRLTGFSGPGNFALWQTGSFGTPMINFATIDGLTSLDVYNTTPNSHAHFNWGFTEAGLYDLTLTATGTRDNVNYTGSGTFRFAVSAVPEPGSLTLLSLAGLTSVAAAYQRRRRTRC